MTVRCYRDLDVWKKAMTWAERVHVAARALPSEERFGITSQLRRASVSVPCNIAEGAHRVGTKEFIKFLGIARGSLAEAETLLLLSRNLHLLADSAVENPLEQADELGRMLSGLRKSLETPSQAHALATRH